MSVNMCTQGDTLHIQMFNQMLQCWPIKQQNTEVSPN